MSISQCLVFPYIQEPVLYVFLKVIVDVGPVFCFGCKHNPQSLSLILDAVPLFFQRVYQDKYISSLLW